MSSGCGVSGAGCRMTTHGRYGQDDSLLCSRRTHCLIGLRIYVFCCMPIFCCSAGIDAWGRTHNACGILASGIRSPSVSRRLADLASWQLMMYCCCVWCMCALRHCTSRRTSCMVSILDGGTFTVTGSGCSPVAFTKQGVAGRCLLYNMMQP